jgi:hypothetical protein
MTRHGHVNPDGPEAADTIEALYEALEASTNAIQHALREWSVDEADEGFLAAAYDLGVAALSKAQPSAKGGR